MNNFTIDTIDIQKWISLIEEGFVIALFVLLGIFSILLVQQVRLLNAFIHTPMARWWSLFAWIQILSVLVTVLWFMFA